VAELTAEELRFEAAPGAGEVSALLLRPPDARWLYVLGHGAGAGMRHPFLADVAAALFGARVATFRYEFPYRERGGRRPDPQPVLLATVRAAVAAATAAAPDLPLFAGGKSMGGRMTSLAAARAPLPGVRGLVFLGFPLHPAGKPSTARAGHLGAVGLPMLFLQGTKDRLADATLLRPICADLGARLHEFDQADHSFHVPKRSGRTDADVIGEVARVAAAWAADLL